MVEGAVELRGGVRLLASFTGKAGFLLQLQAVQVEGITVVSKRHPRPVSQGVRALARVGPLVDQRIIFKEKTATLTCTLPHQEVCIHRCLDTYR